MQFQLIEFSKIEDFEHFLLKILLPQKIVPCKSCFYLNKSAFFSSHFFFFFFFCFFLICLYTVTIIDNFDINWSVWNSLKSWLVTYLNKTLCNWRNINPSKILIVFVFYINFHNFLWATKYFTAIKLFFCVCAFIW